MKMSMLACAVAVAAVSFATETQPEDCDAVAINNITTIKNDAANWSPEGVPEADKLYYIPAGKSLTWNKTIDGTSSDFPGKVALAGSFVSPRNGTITWPELRLLSGSRYSWSSMSQIGGKVVIEAEDPDKPAKIDIFHPNGYGSLTLYADFSSAAGTYLLLARNGKPYNDPKKEKGQVENPDCPWYVRGDWSQFYGTCTLAAESLFEPNPASGSTLFVLPGTLIVESGAWYWNKDVADRETTIGTLTLKDGANFWHWCDKDNTVALTVVSDKLTVGAAAFDFVSSWGATSETDNTGLKVACTMPQYAPCSPVKIPIFKLTGAAAQEENLPDLSQATLPDYPEAQKLSGTYPRQKALVIEDNGDGTKTVYAKYYDEEFDDVTWTQLVASGSYKWEDCPFNPNSTKGVATFWDPAVIPTENDSGVVLLKATTMFNTSAGSCFTGVTFVAAHGAGLYLHGGASAMKKFVLCGDTGINCYSGSKTDSLDAPIEMLGGTSRKLALSAFQQYVLELRGPISGSSTLRITNPSPHSYPDGNVALYGDNSGFSGALVTDFKVQAETTYKDDGKTVAYRKFPDLAGNRYQTLIITNGNALGGTYVGTTAWKALDLTCYTKLKVNDDAVFAEPTRGMRVNWGAQIEVAEGKTFELGVPVAWGGELIKVGAGTLALSGAARFVEEFGETRGDGTNNVLTVKAGALEVLATDAIDGVALDFAEGTSLRLSPNPTKEGMSETGFVITGPANPFRSAAADGKVVVELDVPDENFGDVEVPLCTVPQAVADAQPFRLVRPKRHAAKLDAVTNADGTVTFVAKFERTGAILVIR